MKTNLIIFVWYTNQKKNCYLKLGISKNVRSLKNENQIRNIEFDDLKHNPKAKI